jgi:hypothetical protein
MVEKYMTIVMTIRNPLDKEKLLPVYIEPNDTQLATDWVAALKVELQKNSLLEKNYCWHGWPNGSRNLEYLCKELSKHTQTVYHYNNLGIWQSSGLANIKINTVYTPDTVMLPLTDDPNSGGPNHEVMNEVHNYFEHLQGTVENLSSYYKLAPPNVKYAIRQINNLCHEIETLCLSIRKQYYNSKWVRPSQITTFLNAIRYNLTDDGVNALFYAFHELFNDIDEMSDNIKIYHESYNNKDYNNKINADIGIRIINNKINDDIRIINILLDNGIYSDSLYIYETEYNNQIWKNSYNMVEYIKKLIRKNRTKIKFIKLKRKDIKDEINQIMNRMINVGKHKKVARIGIRSSGNYNNR